MADLTIRPLADRVIVEPAAAETKTASGIIIPDTAQERSPSAESFAQWATAKKMSR